VSAPAINRSTRVEATKEVAAADLQDEAVILNLKDGVYYGLNPVGARIWELVQEPRTVGEIADAIASEYDVEADRAEGDVVGLVRDLAESGLVDLE
jgi:Coenzyme PQQ synthesis protein D (PqqD)